MQTGQRQMPEQVTTSVSYTAAGGTFLVGALSISEWAAIAGIIGVAATWFLNYWVQSRRLKMDQRAHEARIKMEEAEHKARMRQYEQSEQSESAQ